MALSSNQPRAEQNPQLRIEATYTVATSVTVYQGAAVCFDASGDLILAATGEDFAGIALEYGAAGDSVRVAWNSTFELPYTSPTAAINGLKIYASADDTFTTTAGSLPLVGKVVSISETGTAGKIFVQVTR